MLIVAVVPGSTARWGPRATQQAGDEVLHAFEAVFAMLFLVMNAVSGIEGRYSLHVWLRCLFAFRALETHAALHVVAVPVLAQVQRAGL